MQSSHYQSPSGPLAAEQARSASRGLGPALSPLGVPPVLSWGDGSTVLSPVARLWIAGLVLLTLLLALLGFASGNAPLTSVTVSLFLLVELGVAPLLLLLRSISVLWFSLLAVTTSLATTVSVGFVMSLTHMWYPVVAFGAAAAAAAALLIFTGVRDWRLVARSSPTASSPREWRVPGVTALGLAVIVVSTVTSQTDPRPEGLFATLGPVWYAGLLILVGAAVWAWTSGRSPALPVLSLAGVVVLSQAITYGSPTVMSAARHVGFVDYIRVHGGADPERGIYQAWSGLFAGIAWVADAAGIEDPMVIATWWPVLLSPAIALAIAALASRWLSGTYRMWIAAAVFSLTSTLNIVYFSPQSLDFLLALVVFALAVGPRRVETESRSDDAVASTSFTRLLRRIGTRAGSLSWGRLGLIAYLACVMAVSHQLSPYLTASALVVLALFGFVRPLWLPLVVLLPAVGWALANAGVLGDFILIGAIGNVWDNVQPPAQSLAQFPTPWVTTLAFYGPAVFLVIVGLLAVFCVLSVRTRQALALLAAAASVAALFTVTDYGQEGIFRAALFASPWLAILAAGIPWGDRRWPRSLLALALSAMLGMNAYGQTALDWNRVVSRDSAEATQYFEDTAPDGSIVLLTGTGKATPQARTARYVDLSYLSREAFGAYPAPNDRYNAAADVAALTSSLTTMWPATAYYALVSESIGAYDERYGLQTYAQYEALSEAMSESGQWVPVFVGDTTTLYELKQSTVRAE